MVDAGLEGQIPVAADHRLSTVSRCGGSAVRQNGEIVRNRFPSVARLYGIRHLHKIARQADARPSAACVESLPGRKETLQWTNEISMMTTGCR
jgi:hypothetical protein